MDTVIFHWFNGWYASEGPAFTALFFLHTETVKFLPFALAIWSLWFWDDGDAARLDMREGLVAMTLVSFITVGIARALSVLLPYSARPVTTAGLKVVGTETLPPDFMQGLSSMPSDHAAFAIALAIGILFVHRWFGVAMLVWAICIDSLLRIVMARHWPSDIVAGWLVGGVVTIALFRPVRALVSRSRIVPYFEARPYIGYPLLFFVTYQIALLFETVQKALEILLN